MWTLLWGTTRRMCMERVMSRAHTRRGRQVWGKCGLLVVQLSLPSQPCSLRPGPSVHQPSTAAVSGIYNPYVHQTHLSDSRYVRSWIEPVSNHISLSGFHSSSRHSGTKTGGLPSKRTESAAFETETPVVPEFSCSAVSESVDKATAEETVANDISSHSEPKDEKQQQLDPSK